MDVLAFLSMFAVPWLVAWALPLLWHRLRAREEAKRAIEAAAARSDAEQQARVAAAKRWKPLSRNIEWFDPR
jgi:hypothetical protein